MKTGYEPPRITKLGAVRELTLNPPGKVGSAHDGSQFVVNFSCVGAGPSCKDHP